ncbi:MAG: helix-turn-helix domain-containing protein [Candidatus Fimenecus sp.]
MINIFSIRLAFVRSKLGISQKNAAEALNVSPALLSHYEKGIREPGYEFLKKASNFYGVSSDYLLGLSEEMIDNNKNGPIFTVINSVYSIFEKLDMVDLSEQYTKACVIAIEAQLVRYGIIPKTTFKTDANKLSGISIAAVFTELNKIQEKLLKRTADKPKIKLSDNVKTFNQNTEKIILDILG